MFVVGSVRHYSKTYQIERILVSSSSCLNSIVELNGVLNADDVENFSIYFLYWEVFEEGAKKASNMG